MKKFAIRHLPAILIFALLTIFSCVLVPLREYFRADYLLIDTVAFLIIDLLYMHLATITSILLFSFVIFGIYRHQLRGAKNILLIASGALLFKYVAAIIAFSIEYGSVDLTGELNGFIVNFLIEFVMITLVVLLSQRFVASRQQEYEDKKAAAQILNRSFDEKPIYPFLKVFSLKNPLQRITFISIVILAISCILADIPNAFPYGIEDATELMAVFISWFILIIVPAFYSYFLALLFFKLCYKLESKNT